MSQDDFLKRVPQSSLRSRWSTPSDTPLQGDNETWITSFLKAGDRRRLRHQDKRDSTLCKSDG